MGLLIISLVFGGLTGCRIWLAFGSQLPLKQPQKWSVIKNIASYALLSGVLIYATIFSVV